MNVTMDNSLSSTLNEYICRYQRSSSMPLTLVSTNLPANKGAKLCSPPNSARELVDSFYSTKQTKDFENTSLAFQCLYLGTKKREDVVSLIKKHQHYVVFLNSKMLHKLALVELSIIYKMFTSSLVPTSMLYQTLLRGPSPKIDFPLLMVASFHLFVFQSLLQMVSSRVQSIIKKNSPTDTCLFWEVATAFLKNSNFDNCIRLSDREAAQKYYLNGLKMLSGFLKVARFIYAKLPDAKLQASISAFQLKIIQYKAVTDTEITHEVPELADKDLDPFVRDLYEEISCDPKHAILSDKLSGFISINRENILNFRSDLKESYISKLGKTVSYIPVDSTDEKSTIETPSYAQLCPKTVSDVLVILNSIQGNDSSDVYSLLLESCMLFLKNALTDENLFDQCLKKLIPRLSNLLIEGRHLKIMQNLSRMCFEYSRKFKLVAGLFESCDLDLTVLTFAHSEEPEARLINRIEYSICTLLDVGLLKEASLLIKKYITTLPTKLEGEKTLNIIAACLRKIPGLIEIFFGNSLSLVPRSQTRLFNDLLAVFKSKFPEDACDVIVKIIPELPEKLLLATQYRLSQLFDIDPNNFSLQSPTLASDHILSAGVLMNGFKKGKFELSILEKVEKYVFEWLRLALNVELMEHFEIFGDLMLSLFHMGFYGQCVALIERFKSSEFNDSHRLLQLELLVGRCLLEVPEITRLPVALKNSGTLFKLVFACSNPDYDELVNLKLTQLEFFVKMRDEHKSKLKFEEIKSMINKRPEYNLVGEARDIPLKSRLACLVTVARFLLLVSTMNIMSANMLRALKNLKISIKLLCSVLRKLDPLSEYTDTKIGAQRLLLASYKSAFKAAKHLGLVKEAIFYVTEFTKVNSQYYQCPLKSLNNFVSANYLMYVNKRKDALEQLLLGSRNTWDSEFLKFAESASYISLHFDLLSTEQVETEKKKLTQWFFESQKAHNTKKFSVSFLQISELVLEVESLVIERDGVGFSQINYEPLSVFEMLMKAIFLARVTISGFSVSVARETKGLDAVAEVLPKKRYGPESSLKSSEAERSRLIECKNILERFSEETFFQHLEIRNMLDVNALLNRCIYLLSASGLAQEPEVIDLLKISFTIKDLAYSLPYVNQKKLFAYQSLSSQHAILPELCCTESGNSFKSYQEPLFEDLQKLLPDCWAVVTLDICQMSGDLIISRLDKNSDFPFVIKLPFDRLEEEKRGFDEYMEDLNTIIAESNRSTKSDVTSAIHTKEDRKLWWTRRFELDSRLGKLLLKIERLTIGGLVGIFSSLDTRVSAYRNFEQSLNNIWKNALGGELKIFKLEKMLVDLYYYLAFSGKGAPSEFELLEDLTDYTIEQLFLCSKVNILKIKAFILDDTCNLFSQTPTHGDYEHLVLVPSHSCDRVPWESMTFLRDRSVSRMPSVGCLIESLKRHEKGMTVQKGGENLLYVVNPGSDLRNTQKRFEPVLGQLPGSTGLAGKSPSEDWLTTNLYKSSLYIYLGHGGGEQYLRSSSLFKTRTNIQEDLPTALLIGCSSSAYHENGRLQPSSNIFNWLVCGAPAVMTNLWDVTDKDIDIFSLSLLVEWGLVGDGTQEPKSLAQAMIKSRNACTLKFLNGAAPILHGLPLKLE